MTTTSETTGTTSIPDEILHPGSRGLFRYWEALRGEASAPVRQQIDLKQIRHIVPWLALMERAPDSQVYTWRLAGTGVCTIWGREITGREVFDRWGAFERESIARALDAVVGQHQPSVARLKGRNRAGETIGFELLALPVIAADGATTQVFASVVPFRQPEWLGLMELTEFELCSLRSIWTEPVPGRAVAGATRQLAASPRLRNAMFRVIPGGRKD